MRLSLASSAFSLGLALLSFPAGAGVPPLIARPLSMPASRPVPPTSLRPAPPTQPPLTPREKAELTAQMLREQALDNPARSVRTSAAPAFLFNKDGTLNPAIKRKLARVETPHVPVQRVPPVLRHVEGLVLVDEDGDGVRRREELQERELGLGGAERLGRADAEHRPEDLHDDRALARALRAPDAEDREVAEGLVDAGLERRREEPARPGSNTSRAPRPTSTRAANSKSSS